MDIVTSLIFAFSVILAMAGISLTLFNLPGVVLVFIAVLISALRDGFHHIPLWMIYLFLGLTVVSLVLDNVVMLLGGKKYGSTKWGLIGAFLGGLLGLLFGNIVGFIIGPLVGAVLFELLLARRDIKRALKAGWGVFVGFICGVGLKFGLAVGMVIVWLYKMFS